MRLPFPRALALLLAATAALYAAQLGAAAVVSEEFRWAEVAREMRASGDFLRPTINGRTYYDKPVGSYWLIVAASHLTGGVNETAARLPAAVAGVLGVALLALLGRKTHSEAVGLLAGAVLATSFGFAFYARRATADVETVTGVLAALCLHVWNRDRGGPWVLLLWLVMAGTSLTKGLLGFALPVVVMGAETLANAWRERRFAALVREGRWFLNPWTLLAAPLGVGLYLLPFLLSAQEDGLQMVWRENVKRFVNPHNHTGPVYMYAGAIFVLALPWSAFLPAAVARRPRTEGERFATIYFWAIFAFFTLSASRRNYYLLPVLPPLALLIANVLLRPRDELGTWPRRLRDAGWWVLRLGFAACGLASFKPALFLPAPYDALPTIPYRALYMSGWFLLWCLWLATAARWPRRLPWATALFAFAMFLYGFGVAWPAFEGLRTKRDFVADVQRHCGSEPVVLFHARDIVFDLGHPAPEYTDADELRAAFRTGEVKWVIARRRYWDAAALPAEAVAEEASRPWEAADQAGNKMVLLRVTPR